MDNFSLVAPEIFIALSASFILLLDLYLPKNYKGLTKLFSKLTLIVAFVLTYNLLNEPSQKLFYGMFAFDDIANKLKLLVYALMLLIFIYSDKYNKTKHLNHGEFYVLSLFSMLGMLVLISASNYVTLYLGLELIALPIYALVALSKGYENSSEAAMKYFVMGALASGMFLFGVSLLYAITGSLDLSISASKLSNNGLFGASIYAVLFIVVGIGFKFGAVPFHMWLPDVYQGSPTSVTLLIASAPKLAAFGFAYRVFHFGLVPVSEVFSHVLLIMAILSLAIGNIVAIAQSNIKRMLAYSTIAHVGFILFGFLANSKDGVYASFFYVSVYTFTAIAALGMVILLSSKVSEGEEIRDFRGLGKRRPFLAFIMLLIMFSLAGVPPTIGFYAKFMILKSLIGAGETLVAALAVIFSVIGAFYYLRVVKVMFFETSADEKNEEIAGMNTTGSIALMINGALTIILGILPAPVIYFCMPAGI